MVLTQSSRIRGSGMDKHGFVRITANKNVKNFFILRTAESYLDDQ